MSPPEIGAVLSGRFEVTGPPLGQGSTGIVLPAKDTQTGGDVAIKLLHAHLANTPDAVRSLRVDAGAASRLHHPHVLRLLGLWSQDGRPYLVTERIHGDALANIGTAMSLQAALALGVQLADGLAAAHRVGLIHGDVRPGNVLLGSGGALLFDFGLASSHKSGDEVFERRPGHSAPEVHAGGPAGVPADLYGLGIVLHFALTGRPAFEGATPWAVIGAQKDSAPDCADMPDGVAGLVRRLLAPDPTRRPADAAGVRDALVQLQRNPNRVVRPSWRWIAPIRPRRAWAVHGIDPATGAPALIEASLSKGAARALAGRLRDDGWDVRAEKVALGLRDLVATAGLALVLGLIFPFFGAPFGAGLGLVVASSSTRPAVLDALPPVKATIPFSSRPPGYWLVALTGLLMIATAAGMVFFPPAGLSMAVLLLVVVWSQGQPDDQIGQRAADARVEAALTEGRMAIDAQGLGLDEELSLHGDLGRIEAQWRSGATDVDRAVAQCEAFRDELGSARLTRERPAVDTVEALRAARTEVSGKGGQP